MTENVVLTGDCVEVMAGLEPESVDAIVTDPPYGLEFMGRQWDKLWDDRAGTDAASPGYIHPVKGKAGNWRNAPSYRAGAGAQAFHARWAEAAYHVAKPSAYLLAFGGTRTVHRMTVALEDAGWIIRDMLVWAYASGFPKSKASLKPAWEPIVMARKPGPLRMLAIDSCRIPLAGDADYEFMASRMPAWNRKAEWEGAAAINVGPRSVTPPEGRWPANVILTDPIFDGDTEGVVGGGEAGGNAPASGPTWSGPSGSASRNAFDGMGDREPQFYGDSGTYSRFFLIPKADRTDREPVLRTDRERIFGDGVSTETKSANPTPRHNVHPTVKPTDLMRHLVRLVTPPGGLVLDPFLGSGTTAIAAELEGFRWLGIEKEPEYVAIAEARLNGTQRGLGLAG